MEHISEFGNSIIYYFFSLGIFLSVKEIGLSPLHYSLFVIFMHGRKTNFIHEVIRREIVLYHYTLKLENK